MSFNRPPCLTFVLESSIVSSSRKEGIDASWRSVKERFLTRPRPFFHPGLVIEQRGWPAFRSDRFDSALRGEKAAGVVGGHCGVVIPSCHSASEAAQRVQRAEIRMTRFPIVPSPPPSDRPKLDFCSPLCRSATVRG